MTVTIENTAEGRAEALVATAPVVGVTSEGATGHSGTLVITAHDAERPRLTTAPASRRAEVVSIAPGRESRTRQCSP